MRLISMSSVFGSCCKHPIFGWVHSVLKRQIIKGVFTYRLSKAKVTEAFITKTNVRFWLTTFNFLLSYLYYVIDITACINVKTHDSNQSKLIENNVFALVLHCCDLTWKSYVRTGCFKTKQKGRCSKLTIS